MLISRDVMLWTLPTLTGILSITAEMTSLVTLSQDYFGTKVSHNIFCVNPTGKSFLRCENTYQPGVPDYQAKVGGACKNLTKMYECDIRARGEMVDCKDKAQCLEITVRTPLELQ